MDLNFKLFETATLFITVLVVAFMLQVCLSIILQHVSLDSVYSTFTSMVLILCFSVTTFRDPFSLIMYYVDSYLAAIASPHCNYSRYLKWENPRLSMNEEIHPRTHLLLT